MVLNKFCAPPHEIIENIAVTCPALTNFVVEFLWTGDELTLYGLADARSGFPHLHVFHLTFAVGDEWECFPIFMETIDRAFVTMIQTPVLIDLQVKLTGIELLGNYSSYAAQRVPCHPFKQSPRALRIRPYSGMSHSRLCEGCGPFHECAQDLAVVEIPHGLSYRRRQRLSLETQRFLHLLGDVRICPALEQLKLVDFSPKHAKRILELGEARASVQGGRLVLLKVISAKEHEARLKWVGDIQSALISLRAGRLNVDWNLPSWTSVLDCA